MSQDKGLPPWAWVGCGCVGAIVALVAIAVGLGFWGVNKARELGESMKDPEERTERALSALGASELPDGYYAVVAFSVPFVFDFALLSDEPPKEDGEPSMGEHGFIFVSFPAIGEGDEELYDFFEGRSEDINSLRRENMDLDLDERIDRGLIERDTDDILWVTHRGRVSTDQVGTGTDQVDDSHDGLVTLTLFACDDDPASSRRLVRSRPVPRDARRRSRLARYRRRPGRDRRVHGDDGALLLETQLATM